MDRWQPALVGRDAETRKLEEELARARSGTLRCVLVEGEPGIGKTRLAAELLSTKARSTIGLRARGYALGAASSFGLWAEAFEAHLRTLPLGTIRELCGGFLDDLATLLRSAATTKESIDANEVPATHLLEGLAVLLRNLSAEKPTIVLLDDVQLADASSWTALDYLVHNLSRSRVLIIACARRDELRRHATASQVVARLEQEGLLTRLTVGPLGGDQLRELTESLVTETVVPRDLVRWLSERSGGIPLYAIELLDTLLEEGTLEAPWLKSVPRSLSDRVAARLEPLGSPAREVLEVLAVVSRPFDLGDLLRFTETSLEDLSRVLRTLTDARLVTEVPRGASLFYEITHPLVEEAIYERIGGAHRRFLHRRIGRTLLASQRLGEAAGHFARSAEVGDEEAIDVLGRSARQAWSMKTFGEALHVMSALLDLIPSEDERWLDVLDVMSLEGDWLSYHGGDADFALGVEVMRHIEPLIESSADPRRLATFNLHLAGFLAWGNGDMQEAQRRALLAVELFRGCGDEARARMAATELAWVCGVEGALADQERCARDVLLEARAAGDLSSELYALVALVSTAWPRGRFEESEHQLRRIVDIAGSVGNVQRVRYGYAFLALSLALEGRLTEAHQALAAAAATDPHGTAPPAAEIGIFIAWFSGELVAALNRAPQSAGGMEVGRSWVLLVGGLAALEAGDDKTARIFLDELDGTIPDRRYWLMRHAYDWARGLLAWCEHDPDTAVTRLEAVSNALLDIDAVAVAAYVLLDLAEVTARAGHPDVATTAATRLDDLAHRIARDHFHALAAIATAWARIATGDTDKAMAAGRRAGELLQARGYKGLEARAAEVLGRALSSVDKTAAANELRQAADLFDAGGAERRRDNVMETLKSLGKPGRQAAMRGTGPGSLSARELEVISLAVKGLSAKEIGERLYISQRTVESHLANAYTKLGVRSRLELVRRAGDLTPR